MTKVRFPTAKEIFAAAAKCGVDVRIEYGPNGKVASVVTVGRNRDRESPQPNENESEDWINKHVHQS
jgi:hypothetical protein